MAGTACRVIAIGNPNAPVEQGFYVTPDYANGVTLSGSYAYVADSGQGLRVIDISSPSTPNEVAFYDTPGYAQRVAITGNYAFVADNDTGLRVIDVSELSQPQRSGVLRDYWGCHGRRCGGQLCLFSDQRGYAGNGHLQSSNAFSGWFI